MAMIPPRFVLGGPCGGIGRRAGFKIPFWQRSVGSIPTGGTILQDLENSALISFG